MADDDEFLTQTPPSLYPEAVAHVVGEDHADDPIVGVAKEALSVATASWRATLVAHKTIMQDPTRTPLGNQQRSAEAAARRQTEALQRLDAAAERTRREMSFIDDSIGAAFDPPAPPLVSLIAQRMASMKPADRSRILTDALQQDDRVTLGAVLSAAPAWTFGMTSAEKDLLRVQYQHARFPAAVARREALEKTVDAIYRAGQALITAHGKMFDQKKIDHAAALARAADEASQ